MDRKLADLAARERRGIAAIEEASRVATPVQQQATGLRRLFQTVGRDAGPANSIDRSHAVDSQVAALKRDLQAEHTAYVAGQAKERQVLDDRHTAENRQLTTAATHRVTHDRLREQQERRAPSLEQDHNREHEHDRNP